MDILGVSNQRNSLIIFVSSLMLSSLYGVFSSSRSILNILSISQPPTYVSQVISVVGIVVVFAAFYFVASKITVRLRSVIVPLAIGSWIGYFVVAAPLGVLYQLGLGRGTEIWTSTGRTVINGNIAALVYSNLLPLTITVFSSLFFIALTAFAAAYIKRNYQNTKFLEAPLASQLTAPAPLPRTTNSKRTTAKIVSVGFLLSVVFGLLSNALLFSTVNFSPETGRYAVSTSILFGVAYVGYIACPFVIFLVFYWLGKSVDFTSGTKFKLVALALACFFGYALTFGSIVSVISPNGSIIQGITWSNAPLVLRLILLNSFYLGVNSALRILSTVFFIGLAGLAVGYIKKTNSVVQPPPVAAPI